MFVYIFAAWQDWENLHLTLAENQYCVYDSLKVYKNQVKKKMNAAQS